MADILSITSASLLEVFFMGPCCQALVRGAIACPPSCLLIHLLPADLLSITSSSLLQAFFVGPHCQALIQQPLPPDQVNLGLAASGLAQWQGSLPTFFHHTPTLPDPATLVACITNCQLSLVFGHQPMLTDLKWAVTRVWTPSFVSKPQGT